MHSKERIGLTHCIPILPSLPGAIERQGPHHLAVKSRMPRFPEAAAKQAAGGLAMTIMALK